VVEDELVVLAERARLAHCAEDSLLAVRDDGELEPAVEAEPSPGVPLAQDAPALVDEGEAAAEPLAENREQGVHPAAVDHGPGEPLVHLERLRHALQLLVGEVREGRLRDRDEGNLVRDGENGETEPVGLLDERRRHRRIAEAEAKPEPGEPVLGEAPDVLALRGGVLADAERGREQELAALEPGGRVRELGDVQPADVVREAVRAGRDLELEPGHGGDLTDGQHAGGLDILSKRPARTPGRTRR
jgi:hypothetical protein